MNNFSQKSLWIVIGFLLLLNLVLVGFMFFDKKGPRKGDKGKGRLESFLKAELKMTDEQVATYNEAVLRHQEHNRALNQEKRELKKKVLEYFDAPEKADSIINLIADLTSKSENEVYNHFREVRSSLNAEQVVLFDDVIVEALTNMGPRVGPPGGRRGEGRRPNGDRPPRGDGAHDGGPPPPR